MKNKIKYVADFFNTDAYLVNSFNIELRKTIVKELILGKIIPRNILDIGCGDGSLSIHYSDKSQVVLIDVASKMLTKAQEKINTIRPKHKPKIIKGDILNYPLSQKFELILCVGVVAHIASVESLLSRISVLLSNNGYAIIQISDASHFRYREINSADNNYGYPLNKTSKTEFINMLESFGFQVLNVKGYSWSFFPLTHLNQINQFVALNIIRKMRFFNFLSSEWLLLVTKQ